MTKRRDLRTMQDRIDALDCMGEIEGFLAQIEKDGRTLDSEGRHAIARRKVEIQRGRV